MKSRLLLAAVILAVSSLLAAADSRTPPATPATIARGSLRANPDASAIERALLAKIPFEKALATATAAVPGKVVAGELEVEEDDTLQYIFTIVAKDPARKVAAVCVDAGDGRILGIGEGDND